MKKMRIVLACLLCLGLLSACAPAPAPAPTEAPVAEATPSAAPEGEPAPEETPSFEGVELIVSNFALANDKIIEAVIKPFEEKYGCTVVYDAGTNSERLTKLKNDPNSDVDVIYLAQQYAQDGFDAGLFDEFDYSRVPNAEFLLEKASVFKDTKQGPPTTMNRLGIIYNADEVEIASFADLWDAKLANAIAIPDIATTFGPATVTIAAKYAGVDYATDNGEAAFKALEALKPNIVKTYSKSSDLKNMFASGEIKVALAAEFAYNTMGDDTTANLVFLDPAEGAYLNFNTINIVKTSDQKDLAYLFVDHVLSAESQLAGAINVPESTVNTQVELSDDVAAKLTSIEIADKSNVVDFKVVNAQLAAWVDLWNRTLNS